MPSHDPRTLPDAPGPPAPEAGAWDVIVVGAGVTGLRVASGLHRAGRVAVVLEARDRVGGRLLSRRVGEDPGRGVGRPLDLGATWFWPNEPRVQALVRELGIETHPQHTSGSALYDDPGGVQRLPGNPLDVPSSRFSRGAAGLAEAMAESLPAGAVRLETPVTEIRVERDGATVVTPGGTFRGERVVVAVPPALAAHRIRFAPALPDPVARLAASTPVWMGGTTKVVVRYRAPFWRASGLAGSAVSHRGPLREIHDMSGPGGEPAALFGFGAGGSGTPGVVALTEEAVLEQLVRLFGSRAGRPVSMAVVDWSREAWTSPPGVRGNQAYQNYGHPLFDEPVHGRIRFASTETAPAFAGHVEGALLAADRVVEGIPGRGASGAG